MPNKHPEHLSSSEKGQRTRAIDAYEEKVWKRYKDRQPEKKEAKND